MVYLQTGVPKLCLFVGVDGVLEDTAIGSVGESGGFGGGEDDRGILGPLLEGGNEDGANVCPLLEGSREGRKVGVREKTQPQQREVKRSVETTAGG